jgi:hypothetical protein
VIGGADKKRRREKDSELYSFIADYAFPSCKVSSIVMTGETEFDVHGLLGEVDSRNRC